MSSEAMSREAMSREVTNLDAKNATHRGRRLALHFTRLALFVGVIALIHLQHARLAVRRRAQPFPAVDMQVVRRLFPAAQSLAVHQGGRGRRRVLHSSGPSLGFVVQTSPTSDHLIGFSGPTNTLIAFGPDDRIIGIEILSSDDTSDHVARVVDDKAFMDSFDQMTWEGVSIRGDVDAVSGATLTSLAIRESVIHRLSGHRTSLRFPEPLTVVDARALLGEANSIEQDDDLLSLWHVKDARGLEIGSILRTAPFADNIVGYQGPTETRIFFDVSSRVVGVSIGKSFDNKKYVNYVRDDEYFLALFNELSLAELAGLDLLDAEIEGVSGATMTSMAIADALISTAEQQRLAIEAAGQSAPIVNWSLRDFGTAAVIVGGLVLALTSLRRKKFLRTSFHFVLIGYLGLINGDLLSQAMLVGWARNGLPWSTAGGLVLLSVAAFLVPMTTGRNAYCTHLCPHGAAQRLLRNRLPWRLRVPPRLSGVLKVAPALLLVWCLFVAMGRLPFSLVDIEPFDAWVFRVAGWATISIAVVGLAASLFIPLAYCRFGCPTGALLGFVRLNAHSDRWSHRDSLAAVLLLVAGGFWILA